MASPSSDQTINILGLSFSILSAEDLVAQLPNGGLLVAPAAPALATLPEDPGYRSALEAATWILPDSGFMVLLWNIRNREKITRCSGLALLRAFLVQQKKATPHHLFLIDPTLAESEHNNRWLNEQGINLSLDQHYQAPLYTSRPITDPELLAKLELQKPTTLLINLGGGTQELLGQYLLENLSYRPVILCTGAAIAFLTGQQANIPPWADRLYLGWLFRIINRPSQYLPRYIVALKLLPLMLTRRGAS